MTKLSKEQDAEPKSLLESLVTEIYLETMMLTCSLLRLLRKMTKILELKQNRFLGWGGGSMVNHNWGTDTFRKM